MICKCATSVLIREAFGVSGLYDEAELAPDGSFDNTAYIEPGVADKFKRVSTPKTPKVEEKTETATSADIKVAPPVVEEAVVEEVKTEAPAVEEEKQDLMSERQSNRIMEIFDELGYDGNQAQDKIEELEKKFNKAFAQFLEEEADKVIAGMEKSLAKKKEEEKATVEKKSAVGAMGDKVKADQEVIKNSPEFKAAFPEETPAVETPKKETATPEVAGEVFGGDDRFDISDELLEGSNEEELRELRATAKEAFSLAVAKYKETGKNEDLAERSRLSGITSKINQMLIKKGYDI